jgi:hypothetical protein
MSTDKDKRFMKIVELDGIYNFIVLKASNVLLLFKADFGVEIINTTFRSKHYVDYFRS